MITIQNENYDLKYSLRRVEKIENGIGKSLMGTLAATNGMFSISDLRMIFITGLKKDDGPYAGQKIGEETFKKLMEEKGYPFVSGMVVDALMRDCPFFFQAD